MVQNFKEARASNPAHSFQPLGNLIHCPTNITHMSLFRTIKLLFERSVRQQLVSSTKHTLLLNFRNEAETSTPVYHLIPSGNLFHLCPRSSVPKRSLTLHMSTMILLYLISYRGQRQQHVFSDHAIRPQTHKHKARLHSSRITINFRRGYQTAYNQNCNRGSYCQSSYQHQP